MLADGYVTLLQRRVLAAVDDSRTAAAAAYQRGYHAGYLAAVEDVKHTQHGLVGALDRARVRWSVRGQQRTRRLFALPHPADYPGRDGAA